MAPKAIRSNLLRYFVERVEHHDGEEKAEIYFIHFFRPKNDIHKVLQKLCSLNKTEQTSITGQKNRPVVLGAVLR